MENKKAKLMEWVMRAKEHVESLGYTVAHLSIYGSQNYWLDVYTDEYQSDVDYKCVVVPTLRNLVDNSQPVSTTYEFEGGQIDLKDIRVFTDTLVKCNPAYLETLYSEYAWTSWDFQRIRRLRKKLVVELAAFFAKAAYGMAMEKHKALCHPYPSIKDKVDKYGYDPKQLHHIMRLANLMADFIIDEEMKIKPEADIAESLLEFKLKPMELQKAKKAADSGIKLCELFRNGIEKKYPPKFEAKKEVIRLSRELVYNSIIKNERV